MNGTENTQFPLNQNKIPKHSHFHSHQQIQFAWISDGCLQITRCDEDISTKSLPTIIFIITFVFYLYAFEISTEQAFNFGLFMLTIVVTGCNGQVTTIASNGNHTNEMTAKEMVSRKSKQNKCLCSTRYT